MKSEVYKSSMNTRHDLLARILDAVARIKEREDQFRQKKKIGLSSHTSCKVRWRWRFDFWTVFVNSNQRVTSVYEMFHLNIKFKLKHN